MSALPREDCLLDIALERGRLVFFLFSSGRKYGLGVTAYLLGESSQDIDEHYKKVRRFNPEEIERQIYFSGEEWRARSMRFRIYSFFGEVPDPALVSQASARSAYRPSILLELSFDNSDGKEAMTGLFGMQGIRRPCRIPPMGLFLVWHLMIALVLG